MNTEKVQEMHILIVCTGNICRSQLAAGYLGKVLAENEIEGIIVETAGIMALSNIRIPQGVKDVAARNGLKLSSEFGRHVNRAMLERATYILVMEYSQATALLELEPKCLTKIQIIGKFDPEPRLNKELRDPMSFDSAHCETTFFDIRRCIDGFFNQVLRKISSQKKKTQTQSHALEGESNPGFFNFDFS